MSDRMVYVHPVNRVKGVDVITPQALDALLAEGWTIQSREKETFGGKQITVVHLHQEDGREVSIARPQQREDRGLSQVREERGVSAPATNRSYLGGSELMAGMPGMQVTNSMRTEAVYGAGVDAAYAGKTAADCPHTEQRARVQWLKGHSAGKAAQGGGTPGGSTDDAALLGKIAARGGRDEEVSCPYPLGSPHYKKWMEAFKQAGGRIE